MKLTKAQQEIIDLLKNGWELGISAGFNARCWIQKGGIGRGGESKDIRHSTYTALRKAKAIKLVEQGYPTSKYAASE